MEITKRVYVPESIGRSLLCLVMDAITSVLKANNDKHWHPTVYTGVSPEQIKRETEAAGEFWCVYLGDM